MTDFSYDHQVANAIEDFLELIEPYVDEHQIGEHHMFSKIAYDPNSFGAFATNDFAIETTAKNANEATIAAADEVATVEVVS